MFRLLSQLPAEAYWLLISVVLFMGLLGLMALADDLLLFVRRLKEEKHSMARYNRREGGMRNA